MYKVGQPVRIISCITGADNTFLNEEGIIRDIKTFNFSMYNIEFNNEQLNSIAKDLWWLEENIELIDNPNLNLANEENNSDYIKKEIETDVDDKLNSKKQQSVRRNNMAFVGICIFIIIVIALSTQVHKNTPDNSTTASTETSTSDESESTSSDVDVTSVSLDKAKITLSVGDSSSLTATVSPNNATIPELSWTSSDKTVATVDYNGNVTAIKTGTTTITASAFDGVEASCTVTIIPPNYNTGITYDQLARTPDNFKGDRVMFTGAVIQVLDGNNETDLRIAVDGDYNNILIATYNPSITPSRILENDNVTIKGVSQGLYTYQSTLGKPVTIPLVTVDIITRN